MTYGKKRALSLKLAEEDTFKQQWLHWILLSSYAKRDQQYFKAEQGKFLQILNCKLAVFFCIQNLSNLKLIGGDLFAISGASGICFLQVASYFWRVITIL